MDFNAVDHLERDHESITAALDAYTDALHAYVHSTYRPNMRAEQEAQVAVYAKKILLGEAILAVLKKEVVYAARCAARAAGKAAMTVADDFATS